MHTLHTIIILKLGTERMCENSEIHIIIFAQNSIGFYVLLCLHFLWTEKNYPNQPFIKHYCFSKKKNCLNIA
jgi:hypothetical protein